MSIEDFIYKIQIGTFDDQLDQIHYELHDRKVKLRILARKVGESNMPKSQKRLINRQK